MVVVNFKIIKYIVGPIGIYKIAIEIVWVHRNTHHITQGDYQDLTGVIQI